jgi:hypothetical protein
MAFCGQFFGCAMHRLPHSSPRAMTRQVKVADSTD